MNCESIRRVLDDRFDRGELPDSTASAHLERCPHCTAYWTALESLEADLRTPPYVAPAGALVARIQATIAAQPARGISPWAYAGGGLAAAAVLVILGWFMNAQQLVPNLAWTRWDAVEPALPAWPVLRGEFMAIPDAVAGDTGALLESITLGWQRVSRWMGSALGGNGALLWTAFLVCLAGAAAVNSAELIGRGMRRPHG